VLADEHPGFDQRPHAFFQGEGIALSPLDQEVLERCEAIIVPQQGLWEFDGALRGEGIKPKLGVVGLAAPPMLVIGR
jgi:hypothetical protein